MDNKPPRLRTPVLNNVSLVGLCINSRDKVAFCLESNDVPFFLAFRYSRSITSRFAACLCMLTPLLFPTMSHNFSFQAPGNLSAKKAEACSSFSMSARVIVICVGCCLKRRADADVFFFFDVPPNDKPAPVLFSVFFVGRPG